MVMDIGAVKTDLNERETEILNFIMEEIRRKGYPPSVREIGQAVGLKSSSTVHGYLRQLEEKGYIRRDPSKPRALEILSLQADSWDSQVTPVPIVGRVAAGVPILAAENLEGYLTLPLDLLGSGEHFLLAVHGDSMIEAGILDGDILIVRAQPRAENGEIVVAMIGDEATVKRFFQRDGSIELRPENSAMQPIIVNGPVEILGKVTGLIRRF